MQCEEWDDANSKLFKESHDETVHKNSYKSRLYELISASLKFWQISPKIVRRPPRDAPFLIRNTAQPRRAAVSGQRATELLPPERQRRPFFTFRNTAQHPADSGKRTAATLSHCPTSTLAHQPTSSLAHFFLAREGFLVSAIQAVKSSGVTWSSLSAQGFHFSDFFRLWTMSSVFLPVCCSNRYARRIQ